MRAVGWRPVDSGQIIHGFVKTLLWGSSAVTLLFPTLLTGQGIARQALSSFPSDTQQIAYSNIAQLRVLPDYPQIRQKLLTRQLRDFQEFLRSMGTDPDKDVDEVVLGWRGQPADAAGFFGLAEGRFQAERIRDFYARSQLPTRAYAGLDLYAFGSGEDPADLYFVFLNSSTAAFGRLNDLKALLDVRAGLQMALDSNSAFVNWQAELEGTAPQWGVSSAKGAANQAAPWLGAGGKPPVDATALLGPVEAVLYRVEWSNGFSTQISVLCHNPENSGAMAQLLTLWRDSRQASAAGLTPAMAAFLQGLEIQANGSRLELRGSGPLEVVDQVLRAPTAGPTP